MDQIIRFRSRLFYCFYISFYVLISLFVLVIILIIRLSLRLKHLKFSKIQDDGIYNKPTFMFLWHRSAISTFPFLTKYSFKVPTYIMLSDNKSTIIMRIVSKLMNADVILGSRSGGYIGSIRNIVCVLKNKKSSIIATGIDGPRGPEMKISEATLFNIVKKYNMQVRYCCILPEKFWQLNTWDSMYIPKPFSSAIVIDEQILSENEIELLNDEELKKLAESRMFEIFNKAREMYSMKPVEQGAIKRKRC